MTVIVCLLRLLLIYRANDNPYGVFYLPPSRQYFNVNATSLERSMLVTVSRYDGNFGRCRVQVLVTHPNTPSLTENIEFAEGAESSSVDIQIPLDSFLLYGSSYTVKIFNVDLLGNSQNNDLRPQLNKSTVNIVVPEIGANSVVSIAENSRFVAVNMDYMTSFVTVTRIGLFAPLRIPWQSGYPPIMDNRPTKQGKGEIEPPSGVLELNHGVREGVISLKTLPPQEPEKSVDFVIHLNGNIEPRQNEKGGAKLGTNTWSILEPHGVVRIAPSSQSIMVHEGDPAFIKIVRTLSTVGTIRVHYHTKMYTGQNPAQPGLDFVSMTSSVDFSDGEFFKSVSFETLDDSLDPQPEQQERFFVELLSVTVLTGARLSTSPRLSPNKDHITATVTIMDNDNPYGSFSFAPSSRSTVIDESSGSIELTVERNGGALTASTVDVVTLGGGEAWTNAILDKLDNKHPVKTVLANVKDQAKASLDYAPIQTQLIFNDKPASVKTDRQQIKVEVFMDSINEPLEKLVLFIQNATGGAQVFQTHSYAVVSIRANGFYNGEVAFETLSGHSLDEDVGSMLNLTVLRMGQSQGAINVSLFLFLFFCILGVILNNYEDNFWDYNLQYLIEEKNIGIFSVRMKFLSTFVRKNS